MFLFPRRFPSKSRCRRGVEGRLKGTIFGVKTESSRVCILHFLSKTIVKKNGPKTVLVKASICILYINLKCTKCILLFFSFKSSTLKLMFRPVALKLRLTFLFSNRDYL